MAGRKSAKLRRKTMITSDNRRYTMPDDIDTMIETITRTSSGLTDD